MGNDQQTKPKDVECIGKAAAFERNRYFYGKLLTVRDFEVEQRYFIQKQRLINRLIHGSGIVCGLKVEKVDDTTIRINPGVAIDCCGREIVVPGPAIKDLSSETTTFGKRGRAKVYVLLKYDWCGKEMVPNVSGISSCEETCYYSRIMESYKIKMAQEIPEECLPFGEGICDVWTNLSKVSAETGPLYFERIMPRFVKKGEVCKVALRVKPAEDIASFKIEDSLPSGLELCRGSLRLERKDIKKGEIIYHTYWVKPKEKIGKFDIKGKIYWRKIKDRRVNTSPLPESSVETTETPDEQRAKKFVEYWIKECPGYPKDLAVVLASITLQKRNGSFEIVEIDNAIVDKEVFRKKLVFSNPRLYELIKCVQKELKMALEKDLPHIKEINWEHNREYIIKLAHEGTAQAGNADSIILASDASDADDEYKDTSIEIIAGTGKGQTRMITAYDGSSKEATVASKWGAKTIPDSSSKYRVVQNQSEEFWNKLERLEITFDRSMDKETINAKTLNVMAIGYGIGAIGDFPNIEAIVKRIDLPIYFYPRTPEDQVHFKVMQNPHEHRKDLRKTLLTYTTNKVTATMYSPLSTKRPYTQEWEWEGCRILIQLKGDFVLDKNANPLDANHLKGDIPTGNGTSGGLFESWFDIKMNTNVWRYSIAKTKSFIANYPGTELLSIATGTNTSKEITQFILEALAKNNVIYHKQGKYYPLPDPKKTMIVYDGKYNYLKGSAGKLKVDLRAKGIIAEIKSSDELTDKDKNSYEIILLRGRDLKGTTTEKLRKVKSKLDWLKSTGDTEIVKNPYIKDSNVFIIGGKDRKAVANAVDRFLRNYQGSKI